MCHKNPHQTASTASIANSGAMMTGMAGETLSASSFPPLIPGG
jgi:hypothetical protein